MKKTEQNPYLINETASLKNNPYLSPKNRYSNTYDLEEGGRSSALYLAQDDKALINATINIRHAFIRKVYGILFLELLITFALAALFASIRSIETFFSLNPWLLWVSMGIMFVLLITLSCFPKVSRTFPINMILLTCISCCYGVIFGFLAMMYGMEIFLMALGVTLGVVLALTLFAVQVKYDFTGWLPYLCVALVVLMILGVFCLIFRNHALRMVYGSIGALVISMMLVIDTQLICGGKRAISTDDYVPAVLCLYTDVVTLFQYILMLMGGNN